MLQAELKVLSGKQAGNAIPLPQGKFLVGREEDCHLRPNSDLVSRHHCVFTLDEYGLRLRDLGSTNGSFVNGDQIRGAVSLNHGDKVSIGKLEFEVVVGDPASDDTHTNLRNDALTEVVSRGSDDATDFSGDDILDQAPSADDVDDPSVTDTSIGDTLIEMPIQNPSAEPAQANPAAEAPSTGDTQYFPPQGYPQMPVGYPPNMGYPPGGMPYGYPGYPPMGYPQMQGYPPGMYPPQQGYPQPPGEAPAAPAEGTPKPSVEEPEVRLPDPSETGVKPPAPPSPAPAEGAAKDERTKDQKSKEEAPNAAAAAIQQYLQRRPKTGN